MQNEACIKQGSEKESLRQQLTEAKVQIKIYTNSPEFDEAENSAIQAILQAAEAQKMSPKAFIQAVNAVTALSDAKEKVFSVGYSVNELVDREEGAHLYECAKAYLTKRAVVLGFEKSLNPAGWDILED